MWTSALGNEWRIHEPYKPYKLLSIERVAEVLLWRNEKHTITIILALVVCNSNNGRTQMYEGDEHLINMMDSNRGGLLLWQLRNNQMRSVLLKW